MQSASGLPRSTKQFKRRSARVQLRIPLAIEVGDESVLEAETVTVSKHGAKIRMMGFRGKLTCGERMRVATHAGQQRSRSQGARVVWQDKRSEPHYGIELDDPGNFWGVYFPSKDGEWRTPKKPPAPATVPEALLTSELPPDPPMAEAEPILPSGSSVSAVVTGVSAARMPLAERTDVVFTRPDEASALLHHLVEPGATVRLILPNDRVMMGRVAGVGSQRQAGKWRVRIKCEAQAEAI